MRVTAHIAANITANVTASIAARTRNSRERIDIRSTLPPWLLTMMIRLQPVDATAIPT